MGISEGQLERFGDKVREVRLKWFKHVQRRDGVYTEQIMLKMELSGRRKRGKPSWMS